MHLGSVSRIKLNQKYTESNWVFYLNGPALVSTDGCHHWLVCCGLNPLTPELPQHGVPRHNIILNSFFSRNFQAHISALWE